MSSFSPHIFVIDNTDPVRIDRWLKRQIPFINQGLIEKFLRQGKIKLNDQKVSSSHRVSSGDVISLYIDLEKLQQSLPQSLPSQISKKNDFILSEKDIKWLESLVIWEDEDFLVLNKPSSLAVQGGSKTSKHIDGYLQAWGKIKKHHYRLVHRLDRDTSGVFIVAKTLSMATHLTTLFKEGKVEKTYWAIVLHHPKPGSGKIKAALIKAGGESEKMIVDERNGKDALTVYRTIKKLDIPRLPSLTWLELNPKTGRTHQIRVHCQHLGCPIIGDGKYGGREATQHTKQLHLHARSIIVTNKQGNKFTFVAPLPSHFETTLQSYGIEWAKIISKG